MSVKKLRGTGFLSGIKKKIMKEINKRIIILKIKWD